MSLRLLVPLESAFSLKRCLDNSGAQEERSSRWTREKVTLGKKRQLLKGLEAGDLAFWKGWLCS